MRVGMIGLGKLGLPVAYAMAAQGVQVYGHDPFVDGPPDDTSYEDGLAETILAAEDRMHFCGMEEVVAKCDPIFVAVQTPHDPRFEGITPIPEERADFDYTHLRYAVGDAVRCAEYGKRTGITLSVISTVLPGTMEREIRPLLTGRVRLAYNPAFIAMGTTIRDFLDPEFILLGGATAKVRECYGRVVPGATIYETSVPNAELIKVAYNTFIGLKLAFANTLGEVCHKTDCDVDEVVGALRMADRRLISGAYLEAGMGDGGGCHPRDNIALSWLARRLGLSFDLFEAAMLQRENHSHWLCELVMREAHKHDLPVGVLGIAYKPGSHLTAGSPALLAKNQLEGHGFDVAVYDHFAGHRTIPPEPHVWLVGCRHPHAPKLPEGSVVIDPWRYFREQEGVEVIPVG